MVYHKSGSRSWMPASASGDRSLVEIVFACRLQASGDSTGGRAFFQYHRILEQSVEVIEVILQEQCQ